MTHPRKKPARTGFNQNYSHSHYSPTEKLLPLLKNVRQGPDGWRADCPNPVHTKARGTLSVSERGDRVLLHCFACMDTSSILAAVGLELADLYPERIKDTSPEGRRTAREAMKRNSWSAALRVLSREAAVVVIAGRDLLEGRELSPQDRERLLLACDRIENAREVLL